MTPTTPAADRPPSSRVPKRWARAAWSGVLGAFRQDPTFWVAYTPALIASALVFTRSPGSNYIFDEQEALLANPYVNARDLGWWDAFRRDFWGLPPERSIGSYRPLPNLVWRALWQLTQQPWAHHWVNVVLHAINAALLASFAFAVTRHRTLSWLWGASFLLAAVLTEAVSGVVGIADVMGGLGVLAALHALRAALPLSALGVFLGVAFSLGSKESGLVAVPLLAWSALVLAPRLHPERPWRVARALVALLAAAAAFVGYVQFRKHYFPVELPAPLREPLPESAHWVQRGMHEFLRWFAQPRLPSDPINNPLIEADFPHRVGGALRVYARGLGQILFPVFLAGDYSFPQEPIPARPWFPASVVGGLALVLPPLAGLVVAAVAARRDRAGATARGVLLSVLALGLVWFPVAYFPHSNIPVLLPTVRAERFWYLPAIGTAAVLAVGFTALLERTARPATEGARLAGGRRLAVLVVGAFLGWQALRARVQAVAYTNDLWFWWATRLSSSHSAKAHLNYGVMVGARGRLEERLAAGARAVELAPRWPMGNIYQGDTLCRLHRPAEAWPFYRRGFELAPNDPNLIALALQCLWDERAFEAHREELLDLAAEHPGSWLAYLAHDMANNGEKHHGVDPQYRPRGYDEGPKKR